MKKRLTLSMILLCLLLLQFCAPPAMKHKEKTVMTPVIPKPMKAEEGRGYFLLNDQTVIVNHFSGRQAGDNAAYLARLIKSDLGYSAESVEQADSGETGPAVIELAGPDKHADLGNEGYLLQINPGHIRIAANAANGLFYGIQSLRQLWSAGETSAQGTRIKSTTIEDRPRYAWRGMMLDVSRHFFDKEFVKQFIDYLAMHKLNTFHWHLVDDQGWRIEIKKYPRLTEIGAWRVDREDKTWNAREPQQPGEEATYGGFYTQDDIREIVAYAAERYINIVPEIEMPGHTTAALAAYPQYSCSGGPFTVLPGGYWPISDIYCAGNDSTFLFLQDVLDEVIDLFPGKYIHIGGDEADKSNWQKCPKCQARIKVEGLADEHELQSYFVKRMEKFINSRGRQLIGWDEILEGGLAPRATVMSWRGFEGGITAARSGHDVVMSPTSHCYFDYYQGPEDQEPLAIGGYLPLSKVYEFEPAPDSLTAQEAKHILGGQANLWTEYIADPSHAQYMTMPRVAALAEALWTQKDLRDWNDFAGRLEYLLRVYEKDKINYAKSSFNVNYYGDFDLDSRRFVVKLSSELPQLEIHYTLDGSEPTARSARYGKPLHISETTLIKAAAFRDGQPISPVFSRPLVIHKATGKKVTLTYPYAEKYSGGGAYGLSNSMRGSANYADGRWQGFHEVDLEAVIDLGKSETVSRLSSGYLNNINSWIFLPRRVKYFVSQDGQSFEAVGSIENDLPEDYPEKIIKEFQLKISPRQARFIKVFAKNVGLCPDWHMGAGGQAWLFVDEIMVE